MTYKRDKQIDLVTFINDFSDNEVEQVQREINMIMYRGNSKILIDISELISMGQKAKAMLLRLSRKASRRDGRMILLGPTQHVTSMFDSSKLGDVLNYFSCKKSAVQALCRV